MNTIETTQVLADETELRKKSDGWDKKFMIMDQKMLSEITTTTNLSCELVTQQRTAVVLMNDLHTQGPGMQDCGRHD